MKIEFEIINNLQIIDKYAYSLKEFKHNDHKLKVNDKFAKLNYLFSLALNWNKESKKEINGVHILIDFDNYYQEYYFSDNYPSNFQTFVYEIKRYALEEN